MKNFTPIFFFLTLSFFSFSQAPFGVNLACAEFGEENMPGIYNQHYTYPLESELEYFSSKGLKLVRFPFRWERIQHELGGPLDPIELVRIKHFIKIAAKHEVKILLDLHNSARYRINNTDELIGSNIVTIAHIKDLWTKLATELKDSPNIWGYGIMNEPYDMNNTDHWFNIAQEILNGIRTVDAKTMIVVGGDSYSSAERWPDESDNLKNLVDPSHNLIFEAHVYFDEDASGRYQGSYDEENATETSGAERVQPFIDWLKENNFKGFIGEYGVPDDDARWLVTLENFLKHIQDNCINGTYWAAGPWWGDGDDPEHYPLSIEQKANGADRVQMSIVEKYLSTTCSIVSTKPFFSQALNIFPNPTNEKIIIQLNHQNQQTATLYDSFGRQVLAQKLQTNTELDVSNLAKGIYWLRVDSNSRIFKIAIF